MTSSVLFSVIATRTEVLSLGRVLATLERKSAPEVSTLRSRLAVTITTRPTKESREEAR
jgi:hypothetical protein